MVAGGRSRRRVLETHGSAISHRWRTASPGIPGQRVAGHPRPSTRPTEPQVVTDVSVPVAELGSAVLLGALAVAGGG